MMRVTLTLRAVLDPSMLVRHLLAGVFSALFLLAAGEPPPSAPNVLLIIADDLGVDRVGAYGEHPTPGNTPQIDLLAARGLLFRNAWSYDLCSPTRAAILTGQHAQRTGLGTVLQTFTDSVDLGIDETTLADVLAAVGYRTAAIGKWHLSARFGPVNYLQHPLLVGFEHHVGPITNLSDVDQQNGYFDYFKNVDGTLVQSTTYATSEQVDDALATIAGFGDDPWFMWLAFNAPHKPLHAPPAHLHGFELASPPVQPGQAVQPAGADARPAPILPGAGGPASSGPATPPGGLLLAGPDGEPLPIDENAPTYMKAMTEAMDTEIGRLMNTMDPEVLAKTYVVFLGDNGTQKDAITPPFDPQKGKGTVYEGGVNVPLIIAGPTIPSGVETSELTHVVDLFATFAEVAGADASTAVDSTSLVPILSEPGVGLASQVYGERFAPNGPGPYDHRDQIIRNRFYKLWRRWADGVISDEKFFHLPSDPLEANDLLEGTLGEKQQSVYDALAAILDDAG